MFVRFPDYGERVLQKAQSPGTTDKEVLSEIFHFTKVRPIPSRGEAMVDSFHGKDLGTAEKRAEQLYKDFDALRLNINTFKTDMMIAMGDAIGNWSQALRELEASIQSSIRSFEDKVEDVRICAVKAIIWIADAPMSLA